MRLVQLHMGEQDLFMRFQIHSCKIGSNQHPVGNIEVILEFIKDTRLFQRVQLPM